MTPASTMTMTTTIIPTSLPMTGTTPGVPSSSPTRGLGIAGAFMYSLIEADGAGAAASV
jgi:hypothetical protein